jgi:hypothetical protein
MDPALFLQEYFCSWDIGAYGAYFGEQMRWLKVNNHIREIEIDPTLPVDTFWDIGINDQTAIWFAQKIGQEVRLIDYHEDNNRGFADYLGVLEEKNYRYRTHYLPHDFNNKEFMLGESRLDYAKKRGFTNCKIVPRPSAKQEAIDTARRLLSRCYMDKERCKVGIKCLEAYQREYDELRKTFKNHPLHNWASNGADAFMYMASTYNFDIQMDTNTNKRDHLKVLKPSTNNPAYR